MPWNDDLPTEACGPGYADDSEDSENLKEYYNVPLHPRAKKLREKFSLDHKYADLSVAEREYFDEHASLEYFLFFDQTNPTCYSRYFSKLQHNIRAFTLFKLMQGNEIKIFSFDNSAALASLKSSPTEEVLVVDKGTFVIEMKKENDEIIALLEIRNVGLVKEWEWYTKTSQDFSKLNKYFHNAILELNQYKGKAFDDHGNFVDLPEVSFDDIFLSKEIREEVQKNIVDYADPKKLEIKRKNGLPTKRGVILAGEPGTGKTFLSRVLAKTLDITFMVVTNLHGPADVNDVFEFAKLFERIIILFEDIDIYAGHRDNGDIVSALLNKLDGMEVNNHLIVLCSTNKVDVLDNALKDRPGRFDRILHFNSPDTQLKAEMLKRLCIGKEIDSVDFEDVVKSIPREYTGAYLKELYITAVTDAINVGNVTKDQVAILTTEIFKKALKTLRISQKETNQIGFNAPKE